MKELSIEEKARNYDEAYKKVAIRFGSNVADEIFPELRESEDERIRKELLNAFQESEDSLYIVLTPHRRESFIAWLDKHGEQKPVESNDINIRKLVDTYRCTGEYDEDGNYKGKPVNCMVRAYEQGIKDVLKIVKQKTVEWSEEDEVKINRIVACLENLNVADNDILLKDVAWLKSLRPQNTWKPSELQIEALAIAIRCGIKLGTLEEEALKDLIEQLKKLKGE